MMYRSISVVCLPTCFCQCCFLCHRFAECPFSSSLCCLSQFCIIFIPITRLKLSLTRCPAVYLCCFFQSSSSLIDLKLLHYAASTSLVAFLHYCFFLSVKFFLKDKCCHNHFQNKRWEDVIYGWPRRIETSGLVEELLHFYPCSFLYVLVRERCVDVINVSEDDKLMLVRPCVCNYCLLYQTVWVTCILQRKWVYNIIAKK